MTAIDSEVDIRDLRRQVERGYTRVTATVCGAPVWFESEEPLVPAWEAFASAFLIPILHTRSRMLVAGPLDAQWRAGAEHICRQVHEWWGYADTAPITAAIVDDPGKRLESQAQCFSGGADSFYSLLRGNHPTECLVLVHGFDIPHYDQIHFRRARRSAEEVAAKTGRRLIVVRTNLRKHPLYARVHWDRTHGGALAAIGHVLSGSVGHLVLASSVNFTKPRPGGSHWKLDPHWSSSRLQVIYDGSHLCRLGKLREMADEPLVQNHLRVCFDNVVFGGNCSRCDKCVRTMLLLASEGKLERFRVFDLRTPMTEILASMPPVIPEYRDFYAARLADPLPADIATEVRSLMDRREIPASARLRNIKRKLMNVFVRYCP
jgi:hypothetical protein